MNHQDYDNVGRPDVRAVEECAELIQAIAKAQRFGWHEFYSERSINNEKQVYTEIEDVIQAMIRLKIWLERGRP